MSEAKPYDPASEGAEMAFAGRMSYGDYLQIDAILGAQKPLSSAHDEMLFIIQHQTSELWMRLAIHELTAARAALAADSLQPAFKMLARVARIFEQLNSAWDVLRTMTPERVHRVPLGARPVLGLPVVPVPADRVHGRQPQPGDARAARAPAGERRPARGRARPAEPLRRGAAARRAERDRGAARRCSRGTCPSPTGSSDGVVEAWRVVYGDPAGHWPLYELAEKLVDFEDYFRRWRFNHVTTVERVIGFKRGTGGTGGVSYLKRMLEVELFPELWRVRTTL